MISSFDTVADSRTSDMRFVSKLSQNGAETETFGTFLCKLSAENEHLNFESLIFVSFIANLS